MRHGVGKAQIGKSLVTQQIGFLLTQRGNLAYVFGIVEFSANAARVVCLVKQFAKVATARIGHERTIVGSKKSDLIILLLECFGHEAGKSCKVGLGIELVLPCACSLLHVLSEDEGKAVEFGAHLAPTLAFFALEGGATANITFVGVFQQAILLGGERGGLGVGIVVPYLLDALEQFLVETDVEAVLAHHRLEFFAEGEHLVGAIALVQVVEDAGYAVQETATVVKSSDCVLESGSFGIVDNGVNLLVVLLDAGFECRLIMLGLEFIEGECTVWKGGFYEKWIFHIFVCVTVSAAGQSKCSNGHCTKDS